MNYHHHARLTVHGRELFCRDIHGSEADRAGLCGQRCVDDAAAIERCVGSWSGASPRPFGWQGAK